MNLQDKVEDIWKSLTNSDASVQDIIRTTIRRTTLKELNSPKNPWFSFLEKYTQDEFFSKDRVIEHRSPPNISIIKKFKDKEIREDSNNYGFRCEDIEEKTKDDFVVVSLGCSFTYGTGIDAEDRWSDVLCKKIQETTNLKVKNYNLGLIGQSNDYIARMVYKTITDLKPDLYCFLFTFRSRLEWVDHNDQLINILPGLDTDAFMKITNDGAALYNFNKNFTLIESLCKLHNVPFMYSTIDNLIHLNTSSNKNYIGFVEADTDAVDNEHPGSNWHKTLAELFFNRYKKI
tara:strand:+ start:1145 stop:2011 length:867 start_codon:yes stop_codon:yes gene_type:complete